MQRIACAIVLTALALPAAAQMPSRTPGMAASGPSGETPADAGYRRAMEEMMNGMNAPPTGDADRDFVTGMIPHHQGAVDMARIELRYGRDRELRRLSQHIVATQQREIAEMRAWQAKHGGLPSK